MSVVEMIKRHEGWRSKPYRDTEGVLTVGYGFNLEEQELPKPVGELWLSMILYDMEKELKMFTWYNRLNPIRQDVIMDMFYNLGKTRFMGFKKMIKALENQKFDEAADEMLDSKWASQVGRRAQELAKRMRDG